MEDRERHRQTETETEREGREHGDLMSPAREKYREKRFMNLWGTICV